MSATCFNLAGAASMLVSYRASEYWDLLAAPPPGVTINVVRAARSDRRVMCLL